MESLFIRKIIYVCESLLFGNTKITLPTFLKKCKKQNFKIIRAVAERMVAFLQTLPKNLALFQALEPAFEYVLYEQFSIPKEHQEFILKIEKLYFKKHTMIYEHAGSICIYMNYLYLFDKDFPDIMERRYRKYHLEEPRYAGKGYFEFTDLEHYLGLMWLKYGDKKNFTYDINVDLIEHHEDIGNIYFNRENLVSPKTFDNFSDMALNLLSFEYEISKIHYDSSVIHYE